MASHISWQFSLTFGGPSFSPQIFTSTAIFCHIFVELVPSSKDPFKPETIHESDGEIFGNCLKFLFHLYQN